MRLCWNGRQAWLRAMWDNPVRVRVSLAAPKMSLILILFIKNELLIFRGLVE